MMSSPNTVPFSVTLGACAREKGFAYLFDLLYTLVVRDMKVRYEGSVIGVAWSFGAPLLLLVVFQFLFRTVLAIDIPRYSSFAFTGILVWTWVQAALTQSAGAITGSRELVKRPGFPLSVLPVMTVSTAMIHFLLGLPILGLFIVFDGGELRATVLALPLLIGLQFVLLLGVGYLVATANVLFRDTQHLLMVFLQLLFFLSPIFYEAKAVPVSYRLVYNLNPIVHLIDGYRAILLHGVMPDWYVLAGVAVFAAGLLYAGHRTFVRVSYRFVEEL